MEIYIAESLIHAMLVCIQFIWLLIIKKFKSVRKHQILKFVALIIFGVSVFAASFFREHIVVHQEAPTPLGLIYLIIVFPFHVSISNEQDKFFNTHKQI